MTETMNRLSQRMQVIWLNKKIHHLRFNLNQQGSYYFITQAKKKKPKYSFNEKQYMLSCVIKHITALSYTSDSQKVIFIIIIIISII